NSASIGSSVDPGLPKIVVMPWARNRSKVASRTLGIARTLQLGQHFRRRAFAGAHGPVHVTVPVVGCLGAGPAALPRRLAHPRAVGQQGAHGGNAHGTASRPLLARPAGLEEGAWAAGGSAEERGELRQDGSAP